MGGRGRGQREAALRMGAWPQRWVWPMGGVGSKGGVASGEGAWPRGGFAWEGGVASGRWAWPKGVGSKGGRGHREGGKAGTQFQLELPHFLSAIFSAHGPIFSAYGLIFSAYGPNFRACGPISAL